MTPAEFRSYAELAGWVVIGLYLLARLVRGDREISVRIGGSKRKVKLRELAARVEKCESELKEVDKERRGRVPAAAYDWVEKTNKEVKERFQALDQRHDHLDRAITSARARAETALAAAEYAEAMIDRMMLVTAWLAWRAGVKLKVDFCHGSTGNVTHRKQALGFASSFGDIGAEDEPPTLLINDNHCPFPVHADEIGKEFLREVPDHASINAIDERLSEALDTLVNLKRYLRIHPQEGERQPLLSGNALGQLIGHFAAALVGDSVISKEPKEFARQFHNAIRLAIRTAGENLDLEAEHIQPDAKPAPLSDLEWADWLKAAAAHNGHTGPFTRHHALGVETRWGLAYLSLQRPRVLRFCRQEPQGPRQVIRFERLGTTFSVSWLDSRGNVVTGRICCVGSEKDVIDGLVVPMTTGMAEASKDIAVTDAQCRSVMGSTVDGQALQCLDCEGHAALHANGDYSWDDPSGPAPRWMCDHCGKVETKAGELCPACVEYEKNEEASARTKTRDEVWILSLHEIADRLGELALTSDSKILVETKQHGPAYLVPYMTDVLLFKDGHQDVDHFEVLEDPAGPLVMYKDTNGDGCIGTAVSMSERLDDFERAFREHSEAKVMPKQVIDQAALKQATKPPAEVMRFWDQMREDSALVTLFEKQGQQTLYTFGTARAKVPMIGDPMLDEAGVVVGQVLDYNNNRDGDCFATCEAAEVFVAPVIRVIEPKDRDDYR